MSSLFAACRKWLERKVPWATNREMWEDIAATVLLLGAAAGFLWLGMRLPLAGRLALWAMLLVGCAYVLRSGKIKLFGPVLFYDMLQVGRRSRYIFFRTLYTIFLGLVLAWVWWLWYLSYAWDGKGVPALRMAEFTESFFFTFMVVQLVLVVVLTPVYVAGCIAEEKDRKTLEFLLATDLRNREIVLSKLLARVANLALIIIAGLPILSATQFLGGVDPDLLLASFAVTALTLVSLASLSIFFSVHARRPRDAIVLTYLAVVLYPTFAFIALGIFQFLRVQVTRMGWPEELFGPLRDLFGLISQGLNSGNIFYLLFLLIESLNRGRNLGDSLPELIGNYALFHGSIALVCVIWSVARLRAVALKDSETKTDKPKLIVMPRPRVSDAPMLWKEIHAEPKLRLGIWGRIVIGCLMVSSFLPVILIVTESHRWISEAMNVWVRMVGTAVACLMLLAVAVRASGSISGERDRQTFDALLTSPLDTSTILYSKWVGSLLSVRWAWLWLGSIWMLGMITGGINPCGVPLVLASWVIYAGVFAVVGLWFSLVCKTTLRATVWTLLSVIFLGGGHWVFLGMCCWAPCGIFMELMKIRQHELTEFVAFFQLGQTPPFVMGLLAFRGEDLKYIGHRDEGRIIFCAFLGLVTWVVAGLLLGLRVNSRFRDMCGREQTAALELVSLPPPLPEDGPRP